MPIYEYVCKDCNQEFEIIRPMNQAGQSTACVVCGGENVKRKIAIFYAQSGGSSLSGATGSSCGSCNGGSCSTCGH